MYVSSSPLLRSFLILAEIFETLSAFLFTKALAEVVGVFRGGLLALAVVLDGFCAINWKKHHTFEADVAPLWL